MANLRISEWRTGLQIRVTSPGRLSRLNVRGNTVFEAAARLVALAQTLTDMAALRQALREQGIDWVWKAGPGPGTVLFNSLGPDVMVPEGFERRSVSFWHQGNRLVRLGCTDGNTVILRESCIFPGGSRMHGIAVAAGGMERVASWLANGLREEDLLWWKAA